jgi:hypothetical protein
MWNRIRGLFVRHNWVDVSDHLHECIVCGSFRAPDQESDFLTPGAWRVVIRGNVALHFAKKKSVGTLNTLSNAGLTGEPHASEAGSH